MAVKKTPGSALVRLSPFRGFVSSRPRDEVGVDQFTGPSLDWLLARGRIRRRSGSTIFGDTLSAGAEVTGILESAIGFLARRMVSAKFPSLSDGYPAPLMLYTEETTKKAAMLAWRSTNGTDSWRTVGREFSATHYPASGVVNHRVVPLVYENEYGGLTLHRLTTAADRQFLAAGSREMLLLNDEALLPSRTGVPVRWNRRFNDATGSGSEAYEVFPMGLIPPLQVPVVSVGTDLGASVQGPWKGSDAFFYTVIFENERGELSFFPIPRPPGSAWSGFDGFGYFQVDGANPTHYFESLLFSGIAVGPPGTKWVHIARTGKVDVTTTGAGAIVQPSIDDLQFISHARLPNGTTTYVDTDGNDLSLDPDPRITDMIRRGLMWPPCARVIGRFDGHVTLGDTSHNKYALIVAPWESGAINAKIDDASLYATVYAAAVTPTHLLLRKVGASTVAKTGQQTVSGSPIVGLPDLRNVETGKAITGTNIPGATTISSLAHLVDTGCATTDGSVTVTVTNSANNRIGQLVEGPGIPRGAVVVTIPGGGVSVTISLPATVTDASCTLRFTQATLSANATGNGTAITFTITVDAVDTAIPLEGDTLRSIVDRVNADASVTNTTFTGATWSTGGSFLGVGIINLGAAPTGVYIGDTLVSSAFPAGTKVVGIGTVYGSANHIAVDNPATRANTGAGEAVTLQHRSAATSRTYAAGVVPGADMDADADNLLRTLVSELCTYGSADTTLQLDDITNAEYVTPGMKVSGSNIPATAVVTAVDETTGIVTITPATTGTGTAAVLEFYYDTGDGSSATNNGYVRMFGNAFPVVLPWRKSYLDTFTDYGNAAIFSAASPGYAQDAPNTFFTANVRRGAPDTFGPLMGLADLGPLELHFFASGRMALLNTRTGETHNDADYTQVTRSWRRGLRSPYALDTWNGWAIFLSDEGFFATRGGYEADDVPLSADLYDRDRRSGSRGELEYSIEACVSASEGGTDAYRVHAQVHGSILHVRYWTASTVGHVNREIRLDLTPVLTQGKPPAWGAPLTLRHSVSCWVAKADGLHHYAARDSNAGTGDGRVDEIDAANTDNGTLVRPVGYTGTLMLDDLSQLQPLRFGLVAEKAGTGLHIGAARDSALDHADMEFGDVAFPTTSGHDYGREILLISPGERVTLDALTVRIRDNGTGDPPEVSRAILYADPYEPVYGQGG